MASQMNKVLLVCGDGPTLHDDIEAFWDMECDHDVCCINRAVLRYPCEADKLFSVHPMVIADLKIKHNLRCELWSEHEIAGALSDNIWNNGNGGSSTLSAVFMALKYWGYNRVVLAGVPLDGEYARFRWKWQKQHKQIWPVVRSMSGFLSEQYGKPTKEWLHG